MSLRLVFLIVPGLLLAACLLYRRTIQSGVPPIPHFRLGIGRLRLEDFRYLTVPARTLLRGYVSTYMLLAVLASTVVGVVIIRLLPIEENILFVVVGVALQLVVGWLPLIPLLKATRTMKETLENK
jgi:hypothetical protein